MVQARKREEDGEQCSEERKNSSSLYPSSLAVQGRGGVGVCVYVCTEGGGVVVLSSML